MMYRVSILFLFLTATALLTSAHAQSQQLNRISVTERSDGGGLVLRYHLSAQPDSYTIHRPHIHLIQMNLYGVRALEHTELPVPGDSQIERVELFEMEDGVSVDIHIAAGASFATDVYPDVNGRDLLLSLAYVSETAAEQLTEPGSEISRVEEPAGDEMEEATAEEEETVIDPAVQQPPQRQRLQSGREITFGIQAGLSAATTNGRAFTSGVRTGIIIGAVVNIPLPESYQLAENILTSVETGILFTEKGMTDMNPDFLNAETVEFDYMEIPILGKFSLPLNPFFEPYLVIGPSIGFMVSAERIREDGRRLDLDERTRSADLAFVLGGGIETRVGNSILYGQARGSLSLTDTFKSDQKFEREDSFSHQYIALEIGIRF